MNQRKLLVMVLIFGLVFCFGKAAEAEIRFDSISFDHYYIEPGDEVEIYMKFHQHPLDTAKLAILNREKIDSEHVLVEDVEQSYYIVKLVPKGTLAKRYILIKEAEKNVGRLFAGESWSVKFEIKIKPDAPPLNYPMEFQIYKTDSLNVSEAKLLKVFSFDIPVKTEAKLVMEANGSLEIGKVGEIKLKLRNEGGETAKHCYIDLNLESLPLAAIGTSSKYLGNIPPKEEIETSFELFTDSNAEIGVYTLPLVVTCEDKNGKKKILRKTIGIQVDSDVKIGVTLENQDDLAEGIEGSVEIEVANEGFGKVNFLRVILEDSPDYEILSSNEVYVGSLDSDDTESVEFKIRVRNASKGYLDLKVKILYKKEGIDIEQEENTKIRIRVMSKDEYYRKYPRTDMVTMLVSAVFATVGIFIAALVVWFLYKLFSLITSFINRKIFKLM